METNREEVLQSLIAQEQELKMIELQTKQMTRQWLLLSGILLSIIIWMAPKKKKNKR